MPGHTLFLAALEREKTCVAMIWQGCVRFSIGLLCWAWAAFRGLLVVVPGIIH
jgi:hypothetical protein